MTSEQLTRLLLELAAELVSLNRIHEKPEVVIVHMSTLRADNSNFRAETEKTIEMYVRDGMWPGELKTRDALNLWLRFFFAIAVLSELLLRPERITTVFEMRWCLAVRAALQLPAIGTSLQKPFTDFGDSTLDRDRESVLRTFLIDNWNKVGESDVVKIATAFLENMPRLAGFKESRPELGHDPTGR